MRIAQLIVKSSMIKWDQTKWDHDSISEFFALELSG